MPELSPFRALRYDTSAVTDLSDVLCPPYDVISAAERERLAERDPRNAVHVELPESYESAAATFERWQADGTLRLDERPLIYMYEQSYRTADGQEAACRGFFCRLRLEPYGDKGGVRPHERTMSAAKEDRFQLMKAVRANLSPVLFLYDDARHGSAAAELIDQLAAGEPVAEALGPGGLPNRIWLADPARSNAAQSLLSTATARPVAIADGHHRYETALRYCREVGGEDAAGHVLALMYEAHSGGLALRPWHRVLSGIEESLPSRVEEWFVVSPRSTPDELLRDLADSSGNEAGVFGFWTARGGGLLTARETADSGEPEPAAPSDIVRRLDVSVLSATLSRMIGSSMESLAAEGRLRYADDAAVALAQVQSGSADATFLVRPTPIEDVLAVAEAGDYMPAKSTMFYPKAATGLVFNPLGD